MPLPRPSDMELDEIVGNLIHNDRERALCNELLRRLHNQRTTIQGFAQCLDGLLTPEQQAAIPGSGIDTARDAQQVRTIASAFIKETRNLRRLVAEYAEQAIDGHD